MIRNLVTIALLPVLGACAEHTDRGTLGPYLYFETNYVVEHPSVRFDEDGIPEQYYEHLGWQRNPLTVSRWGLAEYSRYLTDAQPEQRAAFLTAADWLAATQRSDGAWEYTFPWSNGLAALEVPWISSIQQGMAISLLARAFGYTGDSSYLDAAVAAMGPFLESVEDGGLVDAVHGVGPTLEEYPAPGASSHVLNGWAFALVGLHELHAVTGNPLAREIFRASEQALRELLPLYVIELHGLAWSTYDLKHEVGGVRHDASGGYMRIHVYQLSYLAAATGHEPYRSLADAWEASARERGVVDLPGDRLAP
jgi:heparosan-N-sulfate-glucuronate 5-epimerase